MGREVAKTSQGGAMAAIKELKQNLQRVKAAIPSAGGVGYLRFQTDGSWVFGADNKELDSYNAKKPRGDGNFGDEVAFNPLSIQVGFTCWTDYPAADKRKNENLGEVLVPLGQDVPLKHELRDTGWPWKEIIVLDGVVMTGKHKGTAVQYSASSKGGLGAANGLIDAVMAQLDISETLIVPVVELGSDNYPHKQWGKTYAPEFDIVEFISMDAMKDAPEGGAEEPEAEEPTQKPDPTISRARQSAPVEEAEVEEAEVVEEQAPAETAVRRRRR